MSECRGCGKEIVWGITKEGKHIPLDPKPPVYLVDAEGQAFRPKDGQFEISAGPDGGTISFGVTGMVSHFATCPKANEFSGKNKP